MVAATWGEAEVQVHIDGSTLPAEVRQVTTEAAQIGGKSFQRTFKKYMRQAGREGAADLGRALGNLIQTVILSSGAFRRLYQATIAVRKGFVRLGTTIRSGLGKAFQYVTTNLKDFGRMIRTDSIKTMNMLREGASHLKIGLQDLQDTFPGITRAVRGTRDAFRAVGRGFVAVGREAKDFGVILKTDSIKTIDMLRQGADKLKISLDDVKDTFPGVTKAARGLRTGFRAVGRAAVVVGREIKNLGPDMEAVRPAMDRVGESSTKLGNRFRNLRTLFGDSKASILDLRTALENLRIDYEGVGDTAVTTSKKVEKSSAGFDKSTKSHTRNTNGIRKLLSAWKRMPHGFRQAMFWITLVTSAMGTLSVLTSALSGTVVALVTILGGLAVGAGLAVIGFKGLFDENAKLNKGASESKKAFQELGKTFKDIRNDIANSMFDGMAGSIKRITHDLLPALRGDINEFAKTVGQSLGRIFDALSSPSGISNFKALLQGFKPIFESMTTAVITFGDAIADILIASLPTAQRFADAIANVGQKFSDWTSSEEGRDRIAKFFETAERIMPPLVGLVATLGDALGDLVTEETISGVETFIGALTDFIPILGGLVGAVANFNVFGILALALEAIGIVLTPLVPILQDFASIISEQLMTGIQDLTAPLTDLGNALGPILELIGTLVVAILPPLIDIIVIAVQYLADFLTAFDDTGKGAEDFSGEIEATGAIVSAIFNAIADIIGTTMIFTMGMLKLVGALLKGDFSGAFQIAYDTVSRILGLFGVDIDDVVREFTNFFLDVQRIWKDISKAIDNAVKDIGKTLGNLVKPISDLIGWFGSLFGAANKAKGASSSASSGAGPARQSVAPESMSRSPRPIFTSSGASLTALNQTFNRAAMSLNGSAPRAAAPASGEGVSAGSNSKVVNVQPGAIVVQGSGDPNRAALGVVNRLAERIAG